MRRLLYQVLTGNSELTNIIPAARWFQQGSIDDQADRPFAVFGFTSVLPTPSRAPQPQVQIWIHDKKGSYNRIDAVLGILRKYLESLPEVSDGESRIVDVIWASDSPDLVDDGFDTNVRYSSFILTGRL